tara:strand:+ start:9521 stop:9970 length:450 start_codon:yes stop_codon:yes gene_type:complete
MIDHNKSQPPPVNNRRKRRGTSAVEFAIVAPVLLLIAFACCDFGRIAHYRQIVSNAARSGSERAAAQQFTDDTQPHWEQKVRDAVRGELNNLPGFDQNLATVTLDVQTDIDGVKTIVVDTSYPFRTAIAWPGIPEEVVLRHRSQFRQFR